MKFWHKFISPITSYFRYRRGKFLQKTFPKIAEWRICDIGGSRHFWERCAILDLPLYNITIYNISEGETQSVNPADSKFNEIEIIIYDGKTIPAPDAAFDLIVCNSVLEHVPPEQRAKLVAEMKRVAKHFFIQTPAYTFPVEPHFIMPFVHWLPRRVGFWLIHFSPWRVLSRPSSETIANYWWGTRLLTRKEIESLFPTESIECEKALGLTKSFYVIS